MAGIEFDAGMWGNMMEFVMADKGKNMTVIFKDGTEVLLISNEKYFCFLRQKFIAVYFVILFAPLSDVFLRPQWILLLL